MLPDIKTLLIGRIKEQFRFLRLSEPYRQNLQAFLKDQRLTSLSFTAEWFPISLESAFKRNIDADYDPEVAFGISLIFVEAKNATEVAMFGLPISNPEKVLNTHMQEYMNQVSTWIANNFVRSQTPLQTAEQYKLIFTELSKPRNDLPHTQ